MPNDKNKEPSFNLKPYETDVAGVSMNKLEAGLWWMKNKKSLKNLIVFFLFCLNVVFWSYSLYNWGDYLVNGMRNDKKMMEELTSMEAVNPNLLLSQNAKDISISSFGALKNSSGRDFFAFVKNPNKKYKAIFYYCFMDGTKEISCDQTFLLPGQERYILNLGIEGSTQVSGIRFIIKNTSWKRVNSHDILNWEKYEQEHLNIKISGIISGTEDLRKYISFLVKNNTAYNFWEVPLNIIIKNNGKVSTVNRYPLKDFKSLEERSVKIIWPDGSDISGQVYIYPDINILDENIYMPQK